MTRKVGSIPLFRPFLLSDDISVAFYRDSNFTYLMCMLRAGTIIDHVRDNDQLIEFEWRSWKNLLKASHNAISFIFRVEWWKVFK
jgi:hypothetical protein